MAKTPKCIFLDTNVYIIGAAMAESPEAKILDWAGFAGLRRSSVEIVVSNVLFEQIIRVAKRIGEKIGPARSLPEYGRT